ncbi:hypothetical protein BDW75DRAFT_242894 [Aspergillus navahoensis]
MQSPEHLPESGDTAQGRTKRAKYTSKACEYCHRRKIKCNGETPCQACLNREHECTRDYTPTNRTVSTKKRKRAQHADILEIDEGDEGTNAPAITAGLILERFSEIERQLQQLSAAIAVSSKLESCLDSAGSVKSNMETGQGRESNASPPRTAGPGWQANSADAESEPEAGDEPGYVGETSINRTLQHVEESLQVLQAPAAVGSSPAAITPAPSLLAEDNTGASMMQRKHVLDVLERHQLLVQKSEWNVLLDLFCEDVYPLYPFLHLPSLRRSYARLLDQTATGQTTMDNPGIDSFAQVLICLALGRCTTSVRAETREGSQSSGWTLYCAALDCVGDMFDPLRQKTTGLPRLQLMALVVVYLIRIDANERAQKVLSLAIVQAHHLGLHRESVYGTTPVFASELSRRLWWCLYILDRRLALDVGQPFLIQDSNSDTRLPLLMSEATLDRLRHHSVSPALVNDVPSVDTMEQASVTPIPYLISMTGYAKIVGKVWNVLYQAHSMDNASDPALTSSFEELLSMWEQSLPPSLRCDDLHPHLICGSESPAPRPWQLKNNFLIYIRALWLRIIIRKPMRTRTSSIPWIENFENESTCIILADRIVVFFSRIFEVHRVYTFPFLQYLLGAGSTIMGLILRVPSFRPRYIGSVVNAAQMMNTFCKKTWVSGKSLRSVKQFTDMATKVVWGESLSGQPPRHISNTPPDSADSRARGPSSDVERWRRTLSGCGHPSPKYHGDQLRGAAEIRQGSESDGRYPSVQLPPVTTGFDFLDPQNPSSPPNLLHSFAPDLANLVLADYPFEQSVSDRNLLQDPWSSMYDGYAAALFELDSLSRGPQPLV